MFINFEMNYECFESLYVQLVYSLSFNNFEVHYKCLESLYVQLVDS